jgi:hypothetical protein
VEEEKSEIILFGFKFIDFLLVFVVYFFFSGRNLLAEERIQVIKFKVIWQTCCNG